MTCIGSARDTLMAGMASKVSNVDGGREPRRRRPVTGQGARGYRGTVPHESWNAVPRPSAGRHRAGSGRHPRGARRALVERLAGPSPMRFLAVFIERVTL